MRHTLHGRRLAPARAAWPASLGFLLLALGCAHRASSELTAVCKGRSVAQNVVLVIDSVMPAGGSGLRNLQGERFDILVNLFNPPSRKSCADRDGEASVEVGDLPDALASAASRSSTAHWRVQGVDVVVDLNHGVRDNNLVFTLPLDGGDGRWSLSRFPGVVAKGRLLTHEP